VAANYWISGGSTSWNTAANWSQTKVPDATDTVIFRASSSNVNCTIDVATALALGITIGEAADLYTGTLDANGNDVTIGTGGLDCTNGGSATIDMGEGTWTCSGNWDVANIGTLTSSTETVILNGTAKTYRAHEPDEVNLLQITGTIATAASSESNFGTLEINGGTLTTHAFGSIQFHGNVTVDATGTLTSAADNGALNFITVTIDNSAGGTWNPTSACNVQKACTVNAGTYQGPFNFTCTNGTQTLTFGGAVTFTGNVTFDADVAANTYTIDPQGFTITFEGNVVFDSTGAGADLAIDASANPSYVFDGDVTIQETTGTVAWTQGTGTITLSGEDQDVDFNGEDVEDIIIDCAGFTVTLTGEVGSTDSLTLTAGTLDIDGNDIDVTGNLTMAAGTAMADTTTGGSIGIGGNLDINGIDGTTCTWSDANIDVLTGTGDADWCTVSDSNNSSGTTIDATDNCTDGLGNTGWNFGGTSIPIFMHYYMRMAGVA